MVVAAGSKAPEFSVTASVSEKVVTQANGRKTVLVFHGNKTQDAPKLVGKAVREAAPGWEEVLVANVVNLKPFSGMFSKIAVAQIKQTYEKMTSKIPDHPEEYVVICTDFENEVAPMFDVADSDRDPAMVVLDGDGTVLASHEGMEGIAEAAVAAL